MGVHFFFGQTILQRVRAAHWGRSALNATGRGRLQIWYVNVWRQADGTHRRERVEGNGLTTSPCRGCSHTSMR